MEGVAQLDLASFEPHFNPEILINKQRKKSIFSRVNDLILALLLVFSGIFFFVRLFTDKPSSLRLIAIWSLVLILYYQKQRVSYNIKSSEKGIIVPYTWLYRKLIPWHEIINIDDDIMTDKISEDQVYAIRIQLDTPSLQYNITGLTDSVLLFTEKDYDLDDLKRFSSNLKEKFANHSSVPNTQAQRLTDQVNRAWFGRWKLVFLNLLDTATELTLILIIIDVFLQSLLVITIWPIFGGILLGLILLFLLSFHAFSRPSAIIGFRPHELGPLIYNEEDVITTVRFIVMSQPKNVDLINCELLFAEDHSITQVHNLKQLEPQKIEASNLTYAVAQFLGNHSKATGVTIKFSYRDEEQEYELPIFWA